MSLLSRDTQQDREDYEPIVEECPGCYREEDLCGDCGRCYDCCQCDWDDG